MKAFKLTQMVRDAKLVKAKVERIDETHAVLCVRGVDACSLESFSQDLFLASQQARFVSKLQGRKLRAWMQVLSSGVWGLVKKELGKTDVWTAGVVKCSASVFKVRVFVTSFERKK